MRPGIAVALCLVVALAGCVGTTGGGATTSPTSNEDPTDPAVTRTDRTATPAVPSDATPENTLAFETLGDRQQAVMRDALDGEVSFGPESPYVEANYTLDPVYGIRGHRYLRYEGRYYRIELDVHQFRYTA